jgi:uncharacterized protein YidB (DUF937 family)
MSFLDQVVGELSGKMSGTNAPPGLVGSLMNMVNSRPGGLAGLVQQFENSGMKETVATWVGTGPNKPISAEQIQQVLGNQKLQELAAQHGLNLQEISSHVAQILPQLVDKLTPNGTIPKA